MIGDQISDLSPVITWNIYWLIFMTLLIVIFINSAEQLREIYPSLLERLDDG
jgi:hypothetical protein